MKSRKILFIAVLSLLFSFSLQGQYTRLVPSWRPIPASPNTTAPDFGALVQTITGEVQKWANIRCMESINYQLESLIASARNKVSDKTVYSVIIDYTDMSNCRVTTFEPHRGGSPQSVIHSPGTKVLAYTIDIYPYIIVNGKYY